jgi:hypothetical protein
MSSETYTFFRPQAASDAVSLLVSFEEQVAQDYIAIRASGPPRHPMVSRDQPIVSTAKLLTDTEKPDLPSFPTQEVSELGRELWAIRNEIYESGVPLIKTWEDHDEEMRAIKGVASQED